MSNAELKYILRKLDFPACAQDALPRIEGIVVSRNKQNFAMQLISEFLFLERPKDPDSRKPETTPISKMTTIQEFELIIILTEYFSQPGPDATRNAVFLSLFSHLNPHRSKILCRLISTSVSGSVAPLLSAAGVWMQQVGCTTAPSLEVAQSLVSDFFTFSRKTSEQLVQLPMVAPHFAANLMTAVTSLYLNAKLEAPPDALLDVFCEWISENHSLCVASEQPLLLPSGAIAMPVLTPLAGLIRWTVLASLVSTRITYSILHLSLLQTIRDIGDESSQTAINVSDLLPIAVALHSYVNSLSDSIDKEPKNDELYQKAMERFAQAIQISLRSKAIYGNIQQLLITLEMLPPHPLMTIIINSNKAGNIS